MDRIMERAGTVRGDIMQAYRYTKVHGRSVLKPGTISTTHWTSADVTTNSATSCSTLRLVTIKFNNKGFYLMVASLFFQFCPTLQAVNLCGVLIDRSRE